MHLVGRNQLPRAYKNRELKSQFPACLFSVYPGVAYKLRNYALDVSSPETAIIVGMSASAALVSLHTKGPRA